MLNPSWSSYNWVYRGCFLLLAMGFLFTAVPAWAYLQGPSYIDPHVLGTISMLGVAYVLMAGFGFNVAQVLRSQDQRIALFEQQLDSAKSTRREKLDS